MEPTRKQQAPGADSTYQMQKCLVRISRASQACDTQTAGFSPPPSVSAIVQRRRRTADVLRQRYSGTATATDSGRAADSTDSGQTADVADSDSGQRRTADRRRHQQQRHLGAQTARKPANSGLTAGSKQSANGLSSAASCSLAQKPYASCTKLV